MSPKLEIYFRGDYQGLKLTSDHLYTVYDEISTDVYALKSIKICHTTSSQNRENMQ